MNNLKISILILFTSIISGCNKMNSQIEPFNLEITNEPQLFESGIISFGYHKHKMAISPVSKKFYFTIAKSDFSVFQIIHSQYINGKWTTPVLTSFSDSGSDIHPMFSPDGNRIYFASSRPLNNRDISTDLNIWYVEKVAENKWSKPIALGNEINTENHEANPSFMYDGTMFYDVIETGVSIGKDIYSSKLLNNKYQKGVKLPKIINTEYTELGPFIDPNGEYLFFYSDRPGTLGKRDLYSYGNSDIYISFRKSNGNWVEPKNLGQKINSKVLDWSPIVTPDGKNLIFSSYRNITPIQPKDELYNKYLSKILGEPKTGMGSFYYVSTKTINELD